MPDDRSTAPNAVAHLGTRLLVVGLALVAVMLMVIFAPVLDCPLCRMFYDVEKAVDPGSVPKFYFPKGCELCWRGRMSLYRRWLDPHSPLYGIPFRN
jgi:hypothetical protein